MAERTPRRAQSPMIQITRDALAGEDSLMVTTKHYGLSDKLLQDLRRQWSEEQRASDKHVTATGFDLWMMDQREAYNNRTDRNETFTEWMRKVVQQVAPAPIKRTVTAVQIVRTFKGYGPIPGAYLVILANNGVAKGTVSKIRTVFQGLDDKVITVDQVTSLNAAYELIKNPGRKTFDITQLSTVELLAEIGRRADGNPIR